MAGEPAETVLLAEPRIAGGEDRVRVELDFSAGRNDAELTLILDHEAVPGPWVVRLNGGQLGHLYPGTTTHLPVPPGAVIDGDNRLEIIPFEGVDITAVEPLEPTEIRSVRLVTARLADLVALGSVRVRVIDEESGQLVPSRITILDGQGRKIPPLSVRGAATASRRGLLYGTGEVVFAARPGTYALYATRGMEWSMADADVTVVAGAEASAQLAIRREVDTTGYIAADTHLHTLTFSGHGNASVGERLVTLAGEGVELAVATDHNHHTDYRPEQAQLGLGEQFLSVTGNEASTPIGHFNGFPLDPAAEVLAPKQYDMAAIVAGLRSQGARVVTLNHPRWQAIEHSAFGTGDLNQVTGDASSRLALTVDAIELANTNTVPDDPRIIVADWLALLNRGESVSALGVSDSHTVEHPPGEGRSYIRSRSDAVADIDQEELYRGIRDGRASVSAGIFIDAWTARGAKLGDIETVGAAGVVLNVRIASASWIRPSTLLVFANGQVVAERNVAAPAGKPVDVTMQVAIAKPRFDTHIVCVAFGPPIDHPAWRSRRPYTMAATNPIYLDTDGDGDYRSPRDTAGRQLARTRGDLRRIGRALAKTDPVIAAQMLALLGQQIDDMVSAQARRLRLAVPVPDTH